MITLEVKQMNRVKYNISELTLFESSPDAFSSGTLGIFTYLNNLDVPWKDLDIAQSLNRMYYGLHSGDKIVSPIIDKMLSHNDDKILTIAQVTQLANDAFNMYNSKWVKLWEVNNYEFDPGENYNMIETEKTEYGKTVTRTDNLQSAHDGIDTQTPNTTENESNSTYGFNSTVATPANESSVTNTGTIETEYDSTITNTGTQTHVDDGEDNRELRRHGNIGVTTTSQMLTEVINLWQWNFFRDVVFHDLDMVLTIPIY